MQPAFTAWSRNGKIVKNSSRSRKKNGFSWIRKKRRRNVERNGARKQQVSVYEVWKKQQIHEDARGHDLVRRVDREKV